MRTTTLTPTQVQALRAAHPGLPEEYLAYLGDVGFGETASGYMIYSGPVSPEEIHGAAFDRAGIVLLGDDLAGYGFGYDVTSSCYGEVGPDGTWHAWPAGRGLQQYVTA
ncbi:hypothetical protein [Pseudomonas sp.]|uniref:hypothetical protein n=1 Tax=Pseudomonas sp. TaxID=306 RepID=UPI003D0A5C32